MRIRMHTSFWTPARAPGTSPHHWRVCMLTRFVRARHAIAAMRTHARRRVARTRVRVAFPRTARCARAQVQAVIQSGANRFVPLFAVSTALRWHTWRSSCRLATFRSKLVLLDADVDAVPAQMWAQSRRRCGRSPSADVGAVPAQMWANRLLPFEALSTCSSPTLPGSPQAETKRYLVAVQRGGLAAARIGARDLVID